MIEFQGVSKAFGDKVVLDDFSLTIPEGETTVLLGYSGTGKSVALKHIVGLIEPDAGDVLVDGEVVNRLDYDEPTTGLDPVTTAAMDDLMVRARRELGATSVVVTHDIRSAFAVADRIAFLYQGRIRRVGSTAEFRETTDPLVREFLEGRPAA